MMGVLSTVQIVSLSNLSSEPVARWTIPFLLGSFLSGAALQQPVKSQQPQMTRFNSLFPPRLMGALKSTLKLVGPRRHGHRCTLMVGGLSSQLGTKDQLPLVYSR
jgi:hypothetical protein